MVRESEPRLPIERSPPLAARIPQISWACTSVRSATTIAPTNLPSINRGSRSQRSAPATDHATPHWRWPSERTPKGKDIADTTPGDDLSAIIDEKNRPSRHAPRRSFESVERQRGVHGLAGGAEQAGEITVGCEGFAGRQHPPAVPIQLFGRALDVERTRGRPQGRDSRHRHRRPRQPTVAARPRQRQQPSAQTDDRNRRRFPMRPRPAHRDRRQREQPGFGGLCLRGDVSHFRQYIVGKEDATHAPTMPDNVPTFQRSTLNVPGTSAARGT